MPRTKKPRVSKKVDENSDPNKENNVNKINSLIKDYDATCKDHLGKLRFECTDTLTAIDVRFQLLRMSIPESFGKMTLQEIREQTETASRFISSSETIQSSGVYEVTRSTSRNAKKHTKRSLSLVNDEGYLTAESVESSLEPRRSRATKRTAPRQARASRSLSKSKMPQPVNFHSSHKTPLNSAAVKSQTYGFITPKVKPNTPQVVLRRPKEGEMAVSMQGSPLMVNPIVGAGANVNIPLNNGTTISIQPQRGLRMSQFPPLDPSVRRQIEALRDNLIKVCQLPK